MMRFFIRLTALAIVASLPIPLDARGAGADRHSKWDAKSWLASWEARQGPETTEKIAKSFRVGPNGTLDINNMSGRIIVNTGGTDTIVIDAVKRVRARGGDVKDQLERAQVTMTERTGRVEVKTIYTGRNLRTSVDYVVTAPAGTSVYAHSVSGDIKVTNIRGEVRIDAVSGDVSGVSTPGATLVQTVSGDASVSGVSNQNELRIFSTSGNVTVNSAKVRSVAADSISGEILLVDVTCDRAIAKSIGGSINFDGPLVKGGRYEFKSHSGDIHLAVTATSGFEVNASAFSGNVRSDLPITLTPGESLGGHGIRKRIRGVHGDGSAQLLLSSFSGDVTIAKK